MLYNLINRFIASQILDKKRVAESSRKQDWGSDNYSSGSGNHHLLVV